MDTLIVFTTFPDIERARLAAHQLVEQGVAACVNILPGVTSVYRWQGKVEESGETLLLIKTTEAAYPLLESALKACHPYELPEIAAVSLRQGLPEYLGWVAQETVLPQQKAE